MSQSKKPTNSRPAKTSLKKGSTKGLIAGAASATEAFLTKPPKEIVKNGPKGGKAVAGQKAFLKNIQNTKPRPNPLLEPPCLPRDR